ncbi:MAG: molybdenum cofactor guanylyltransferase [Rhodospirillales bacterium]|nr:molybdenum cofactor guanylyltransferase [Rhodospirillales bacterium]
MPAVAVLILAGGAGRRLGGVDKPLLDLGGRTILARILARLAPQLAVAISANGDAARFAAFGHPVLGDGALAGQGPLAGLLAGLNWAAGLGAEALLSLPGDTPFLPPDLDRALAPAPAVACAGGRIHHLVALWPVAARSALAAYLAGTQRRDVGGFAGTLRMRHVDFPLRDGDPFLNVNTVTDLAQARAIAARESGAG